MSDILNQFDYIDPDVPIMAPWIGSIKGHKVTVDNDGVIKIDGKLTGRKVDWTRPFREVFKVIHQAVELQDIPELLSSVKDSLQGTKHYSMRSKNFVQGPPWEVKDNFNKVVSYFDTSKYVVIKNGRTLIVLPESKATNKKIVAGPCENRGLAFIEADRLASELSKDGNAYKVVRGPSIKVSMKL